MAALSLRHHMERSHKIVMTQTWGVDVGGGGPLIISHIWVHKLYYETHDLFSSTKSQIYDKNKHEQVKVIILYKAAMGSNIFLLNPAELKIGHT